MDKFILGIQSYASHDSGAAIVKFNTKTKTSEFVAISEERLLRKKYPYTFPLLSILYCLNYFNLKNLKKINFLVSDWIRVKKWIRSGPSYDYSMFDYIKEKLKFDQKKIIQINHHLAHASSVYYTSNFKKSSILIVDGNGSDIETNSYFFGSKNKIKLLENFKFEGIGTLYKEVSKSILNFGTGGEGKTMGLAPYGQKNNNIFIKHRLKGIETYFTKFLKRMPHSDILNHLNDKFRNKFINIDFKKRKKNQLPLKIHKDWAFAVQKLTEKVMIHLSNDLFKKNKNKNICLAGGVALNSVANESIMGQKNFSNIHVFPASSDSGVPFGLALWGYHNLFKAKKRVNFVNAYTGIEYSNELIINLLEKNNINFLRTTPFEIAKLISEGAIVGHFNGASEYGPRALGNRSILADPRKKYLRHYINKHVKKRELFRPFAPAVLKEFSNLYFAIKDSPYMLRVAKARKPSKIPAAIHVDNTARVQTVTKNQNERFYDIINEFYKLTKVPCILNTSFNGKNEPIVETPEDALITFLESRIDYLILNDFLVRKDELLIINRNMLIYNLKNERSKRITANINIALNKICKKTNIREYNKNKYKFQRKAIYHSIIKPVDFYIKFFRKIKLKEKILILGEYKHTKVLLNIVKIKKNQMQNIDYLPIDKNKGKISLNLVNSINKKYDKILLSTFNYCFYKKIGNIEIKKTFFNPYDNSTRSIEDYFKFSKYNFLKRYVFFYKKN